MNTKNNLIEKSDEFCWNYLNLIANKDSIDKYDSYDNQPWFVPNKPERWFDRVQETHKSLRKTLNGIRKIQRVKTTLGYDKPSLNFISNRDDDFRYCIEDILRLLPKYLKEYSLKEEDLCYPILKNGIKTTKHILTYASKMYRKDTYELSSLNHICSNLGQVYADARIKDIEMYVNITTSALGFAKLGMYGADSSSCFGIGGGNQDNKFKLGCTENTFVLLIAKKENGVLEDNFANKAVRCWGFTTNNNRIFHICNPYQKGEQHQNAEENDYYDIFRRSEISALVSEAIKGIFGTKDIIVKEDIIQDVEGVSFNGSPTWSFAHPKQKIEDKIKISINSLNSYK